MMPSGNLTSDPSGGIPSTLKLSSRRHEPAHLHLSARIFPRGPFSLGPQGILPTRLVTTTHEATNHGPKTVIGIPRRPTFLTKRSPRRPQERFPIGYQGISYGPDPPPPPRPPDQRPSSQVNASFLQSCFCPLPLQCN